MLGSPKWAPKTHEIELLPTGDGILDKGSSWEEDAERMLIQKNTQFLDIWTSKDLEFYKQTKMLKTIEKYIRLVHLAS